MQRFLVIWFMDKKSNQVKPSAPVLLISYCWNFLLFSSQWKTRLGDGRDHKLNLLSQWNLDLLSQCIKWIYLLSLLANWILSWWSNWLLLSLCCLVALGFLGISVDNCNCCSTMLRWLLILCLASLMLSLLQSLWAVWWEPWGIMV